MATALTTRTGPNCRTGSVPVAVLEMFDAPDSGPGTVHTHPEQTLVHVLDGVVYVVAGENEWVLTPGDLATIEPGTTYKRWNAGEEFARWVELYCSSSA